MVITDTLAQKIQKGYIFPNQVSQAGYKTILSLPYRRATDLKAAARKLFDENKKKAETMEKMKKLQKKFEELGGVGEELYTFLFDRDSHDIQQDATVASRLNISEVFRQELESAFQQNPTDLNLKTFKDFKDGFSENLSLKNITDIVKKAAKGGNAAAKYFQFLDALQSTFRTISKMDIFQGDDTASLGSQGIEGLIWTLTNLYYIYEEIYSNSETRNLIGDDLKKKVKELNKESGGGYKNPSNQLVGFANNVKGAALELLGPVIVQDLICEELKRLSIDKGTIKFEVNQTGLQNKSKENKGDFALTISRTGPNEGTVTMNFSAKAFSTKDTGPRKALGSVSMTTIRDKFNSDDPTGYDFMLLLNTIGVGLNKGISSNTAPRILQYLAQLYLTDFLGEDTHFMLYNNKLLPIDKFIQNHMKPFTVNPPTVGNVDWKKNMNDWYGSKLPNVEDARTRVKNFRSAILKTQAKLFIAGKPASK